MVGRCKFKSIQYDSIPEYADGREDALAAEGALYAAQKGVVLRAGRWAS